jgi:choline dehydrogenase
VTRYDARPSARSAAVSAINPHFNGAEQEGARLHQHYVRGGLRFHTALAFLDPVRGRANLTVITGALVTGLVIDGHLVTDVRARVGGADCVIEGRETIGCTTGARGTRLPTSGRVSRRYCATAPSCGST